MSVIFGIHSPSSQPVTVNTLEAMGQITTRWAPDGAYFLAKDRIGMACQMLHTHPRSSLESGPRLHPSGDMVSFDGRLDNYKDLTEQLGLSQDTPDSVIILTGFKFWGPELCCSKLVGDWALAFWSEGSKNLYLARDHAGTRTLFYSLSGFSTSWSSYLENLIMCESAPRSLDLTYAARYITGLPLGDATPYERVYSVPPAHLIRINRGVVEAIPHWRWIVPEEIRYSDERDYDEHFLKLFEQAVVRRMNPTPQVIAQLSGGIDSSSIVCMADYACSRRGESDLLDTMSFYDDSEPSLDDRKYFELIEDHRNKRGVHIESSFAARTYLPPATHRQAYLLPGPDSYSLDKEQTIADCLGGRNYKVVLSGIGGDELLGGVPSPLPELADYLASGQLKIGASRLVTWCLATRTPVHFAVANTIGFLIDSHRSPRAKSASLPPWLTERGRKLCVGHTGNSGTRRSNVGGLGILPSHLANAKTWWQITETLPHQWPEYVVRREFRYPFLDRDLVDYLLRVPPTQLVQPHRRRYMMRRALKGMVPPSVLERRRKGFCNRGPLVSLTRVAERLLLNCDLQVVRCGLVRKEVLLKTLTETCRNGDSRWSRCLMRTFALEGFLMAGIASGI